MKKTIMNIIETDLGEGNLKKILDKSLPSVKEDVQQAYALCVEGKIEEARELCERIVSIQPDLLEIQYLLAQCLYYLSNKSQGQENLRQADSIMKYLRKQCPADEEVIIMSGKVSHALGDYREAAGYFSKVCPLKEYQPFVYQLCGDCLMNIGQPGKALSWYHLDLEQYEKSGKIPHAMMLDGSFQNTLFLDIEWNVGRLPRDLELYKKFLDQVGDESDKLQPYISDIVICISKNLSRKSLRIPFLRFLDFLEEKDILKGEYETTVYSGYIALESFYMHEDKKVSSFVEDYIANVSDYIYEERQKEKGTLTSSGYQNCIEEGTSAADMRYMSRSKYLTYNWYMCRYYHDHTGEMKYVKETYPHSWDMAEKCFYRIQDEPETYQKALVTQMLGLTQSRRDIIDRTLNEEKIISQLNDLYEDAVSTKKEPVRIDSGTTFRRGETKPGRNDPCPCGSGKKYKKCCGKGV